MTTRRDLCTLFAAGTLLSLVTALAIMPLFASYQDRHSQRSIFLRGPEAPPRGRSSRVLSLRRLGV